MIKAYVSQADSKHDQIQVQVDGKIEDIRTELIMLTAHIYLVISKYDDDDAAQLLDDLRYAYQVPGLIEHVVELIEDGDAFELTGYKVSEEMEWEVDIDDDPDD